MIHPLVENHIQSSRHLSVLKTCHVKVGTIWDYTRCHPFLMRFEGWFEGRFEARRIRPGEIAADW